MGLLELFKLLGTIVIEGVEKAKKDIDDTSSTIQNLKKKVEEYKKTGLSTSDSWKKATEEMRDNAELSASDIEGSLKKIGAAVTAYVAVDKIKDFGLACITAAANMQATGSQFAQVFDGVGESATASLTRIATEAGINENRMKESFTKIAAFAQTTGMETADALALSERAMIAVADSAAFYDRTLEETTESLQSFLKGNFENDAALGLSCTETTRNAAANELYGKSFIELSEAQKQLTLLKMVEDANALSGALGQASRESETWTNQTGNLKQAWTDFTAKIGEGFLPVAVEVVMRITDIVTWMTEHQSIVTTLAIAVGTLTTAIIAYNVAQTMATTGMTLATAAGTAFGAVMAFITSPITLVIAAIGALVAAGVLLYQNWDTIKETALELWSKLTEVFGKIKTTIVGTWQGIWTEIKGILNNIINGIETMINGAISALNGLISGLNKAISLAGSLLGLDVSIPTIPKLNLPRLEEGGILEKGQVGLLEGKGAEAVVPLDQNSAWISAVAKDMEAAGIGGNNQQTQRIIDLLEMLVEMLPDTMKDAFASMKMEFNKREVARMVKAVN
jgi:phage-related minor tail protein